MIVQFFDYEQEEANPYHGATASTPHELINILEFSRAKYPLLFVASLQGENGEELALGIGDPGFVELQSTNALAVRPGCNPDPHQQPPTNPPYPEFACGGTPTPIPWEHTVPFPLVNQIAVDFLETGGCSKSVEWY